MMKQSKLFAFFMILILAVLSLGMALAADCPIVGEIEISPKTLNGPGDVQVKITISNSGDTDLQDPVVLYTSQGKVVSDFGSDGNVMLKAGESKTWEGICSVNTRTLNDGKIVYYVMYTDYDENGQATKEKQLLSAEISQGNDTATDEPITVSRVITPSVAKEDQEITVKYTIANNGTTSLYNITIKENKNINSEKKTIPELKAGAVADITYTVKMGKKALTSSATITYATEEGGKTQTYKVEEQKINIGEPKLSVSLASSAKGVVTNGTVTLTLTLKNTGTVGYSDIRVTDPVLGEVFSGEEVAAGKTLKLQKEVTIPETMDFAFTVQAVDETGSDFAAITESVTVTAVNEEDTLQLEVEVSADRTLVYETPGRVHFTIAVRNTGNVDAKDVTVKHGEVEICELGSIKAGESKTITRDTLVSMSGRMRFTVIAVDPLENHQTFTSNDIQIVLTAPTAAPATATPKPVATPIPTPFQATVPPISDASIAPGAKTVNRVVVPFIVILALVVLVAVVLIIVAKIRRAANIKASENAVDHLERSEHRDYAQESTGKTEQSAETENNANDYEDAALPEYNYAEKAGFSNNEGTEDAPRSEDAFATDGEEALPRRRGRRNADHVQNETEE